MSDLTRRDILRGLALTMAAAGVEAGGAPIDAIAGEHVHQMASASRAASGGTYTPKALTPHEYRTLERLTDLIIPIEDGKPGALAAGAAAWIDLLASANAELFVIHTGGIAWLDRAMRRRVGTDFVEASAADQTAMLDLIAYRRNDSPELGPGIRYFDWARKMTVDAFYTSAIGIKDLDYRGNTPQASFEVPAASLRHALDKFGSA